MAECLDYRTEWWLFRDISLDRTTSTCSWIIKRKGSIRDDLLRGVVRSIYVQWSMLVLFQWNCDSNITERDFFHPVKWRVLYNESGNHKTTQYFTIIMTKKTLSWMKYLNPISTRVKYITSLSMLRLLWVHDDEVYTCINARTDV